MAETQHPTSCIMLGPGGLITDPTLVKELEGLPILQPHELAQLAIYFNAFSTNTHLADVLAENVVATILTNRSIALLVKEHYALNAHETLEDWGWIPQDDPNEETNVRVAFVFALVSGIGLVIQKLLKNEEATFYVVGVSPDPKDLPDPEDSEESTPASPK